MRMPPKPEKPDEKPADEKKPVTSPAAADDAGDDDDELPTDPVQLKSAAKKLRKQLRAAERKLDDAGLTRAEEKRLTDEVAVLSAKIDTIASAMGEKPEADEKPAGVVPAPASPAAADDDDDDCPVTLL